jgi:hypothetical protein
MPTTVSSRLITVHNLAVDTRFQSSDSLSIENFDMLRSSVISRNAVSKCISQMMGPRLAQHVI